MILSFFGSCFCERLGNKNEHTYLIIIIPSDTRIIIIMLISFHESCDAYICERNIIYFYMLTHKSLYKSLFSFMIDQESSGIINFSKKLSQPWTERVASSEEIKWKNKYFNAIDQKI